MGSNVVEFTIKGTDNFSGAMGKAQKSIASVTRVVTAAATAFVAASAGAVLFVNRMTKAQDRAAKFAKRLQMTVEELTALEFAGERSGLSIQQLDMSIQRLQRRSEEAAKGMGEAQGALKDLGIDAAAFTKLPMEEKLAQIADGLEGVEDKTRVAFKLFDSEGVGMIQMLGRGSDGFRTLTAEARKFGAVIDSQGAANAEAFQDSMTNLQASTTGIFRGISDELAPIFTNMINRLANFFANSREGIVQFTENFIRGIFTIAHVFETVFNSIGSFLNDFLTKEGFVNNFKAIGDAFVGTVNFMFDYLVNAWSKMGNFAFDVFKLAFEKITGLASWAWDNIVAIFTGGDLSSPLDLMFDPASKSAERALENVKQSGAEWMDAIDDFYVDGVVNIGEAFGITSDTIGSEVDDMMARFSTFGEVVDQTNEKLVSGTEVATTTMAEMWRNFMIERGNDLTAFNTALFDTLQATVDSISTGMADLIVDGGSILTTFKNIAKQVAKDVIAALIRIGLQRLVTSAIGITATKAGAVADASRSIGATFANTMASMSMAPFPINLSAPAVAAAHTAQAVSGFSAGAATGAGLGAAIAHGGLDYVPKESTFLLDKGERVLSPNQNAELIDFMRSGGGGVSINNLAIEIFPNATNADALLSMDPKDIKEIVADKIIDALNQLDEDGVRPNFVGRG